MCPTYSWEVTELEFDFSLILEMDSLQCSQLSPETKEKNLCWGPLKCQWTKWFPEKLSERVFVRVCVCVCVCVRARRSECVLPENESCPLLPSADQRQNCFSLLGI